MPPVPQRRCDLILAPPIAGSLQAPAPSTGIRVNQLRTQFRITKTITKEPNKAEIQVWNLAASTRASLQSKGTRVILLAGYDDSVEQLFSGDSRTIDHVRDGANWITKIQCGDGERNYRFALVSEAFKPGAKVTDAIKKAVTAMALDPGNAADKLANITAEYVSGYAMHGKASAELDSMLAGQGLEWSIQDGRLQLLAPGETTSDAVLLLNEQTPLIGSPTYGTPELIGIPSLLKVKVLLKPAIRPGRKVQVQSAPDTLGHRSVDGFFKVEKMRHTGDTAGGEWYTECEVRAL